MLAFGWNERYKVAVGVAEALDYLHREKAPPVIHRDVKSSNILLSDDFEPQVHFSFSFLSLIFIKPFHVLSLDFSAVRFRTGEMGINLFNAYNMF